MTKKEMNEKGVSIVLGSYNRLPFLKLTIESIRQEIDRCDFPCEILVSDGGSTDGSIQWLAQQKDIVTVIQHNRGEWRGKKIERRSWGYFMNLIFKAAQGKYVCMVSDDCLIVPNSLKNGYKYFEKKLNEGINIGALAFYWRNWPEQQEYWVGLALGEKMFVNHGMYLRKALEDVDFIDEDTFMFYHADGDLCLKIWDKGYVCLDSPDSYVEHYSHANLQVRKSNNEMQQRDWNNYINKWKGKFENNNKRDWIEKEYIDSNKTADQFKLSYLKHKITKKKDYKTITKNIVKKIIKN